MKQKPEIRDRIKELRRVCATDLVPAPVNWRTHSTKQKTALASVLEEIGIADAVLARELPDGRLQLIDGHLRRETLGESLLPVLVLDVSEREAAILLATIDPLAAMAGTDAEKLDAILREAVATTEGVQELLAEIADDAGLYKDDEKEIVEDEAPEPPPEPITRPGDLWLLGDHRLLCGDSTKAEDVERLMAGAKADLLVTSPPYNQSIDKFKPSGMHKEGDWVGKVGRLAYADSLPEPEYQDHQRLSLDVWFTVMADGGSVFYNHKNRYRDKRLVSPLQWLPGPFTIRQEIVWLRPGSVTQNARMFLPCDERIYWMYKGANFYFDDSTEVKTWSSVWKIGLETNKTHAVAFPVELPARCIRACSQKGGLVFEPHCGSGTTLIAAEQLGRRCYGLEISPAYCDVIVARWEKITGRKATLERFPHPPEHVK